MQPFPALVKRYMLNIVSENSGELVFAVEERKYPASNEYLATRQGECALESRFWIETEAVGQVTF